MCTRAHLCMRECVRACVRTCACATSLFIRLITIVSSPTISNRRIYRQVIVSYRRILACRCEVGRVTVAQTERQDGVPERVVASELPRVCDRHGGPAAHVAQRDGAVPPATPALRQPLRPHARRDDEHSLLPRRAALRVGVTVSMLRVTLSMSRDTVSV